jgi:hypothetical protein
MDDVIMDSLSKLRSNANAARTSKRPERKRELMISIGLTPEEDEGAEQMMGDEHEMMEGDRGMDAGVDTRPSDLVQSSEEEMRRRRMGY